MKYGVFISYSHSDESLVLPIVALVSTMRKDLVFLDKKELIPGKKWEPQILEALDQAEIVIVFWCKHSAKSAYVRKEYKAAIEKNKDILPILLDKTKVNKALAAYQWIDFTLLISNHEITKVRTTKSQHRPDFQKQWVYIVDPKTGLAKLVKGSPTIGYNRYLNNKNLMADQLLHKLNEKIPPLEL